MSDLLPSFLGLAEADSGRSPARCRVLPVPFEATVSYEGGTANGPRAILEASAHVELYDRSVGDDAYVQYGVATLAAFQEPAPDAEAFVDGLATYIAKHFDPERLIVGLGGEHTVTVGLARGTRRALGRPLTLVQIDAHADLRDEYESNRYSHACVARRLLDEGVGEVVQFGIRSVCLEEAQLIDRDPRVHVYWADEIHDDRGGDYLQTAARLLAGTDVYLTIDVDGLDPGVIPATGTPEPNGLTWRQTLEIIKTVTSAATVVGMDVVELAPRRGLHAADFAAAKLTYQAVNLIAAGRDWM